ncbi:malate synthase G [Salinibacillus aidingensis]|uniref:Malate synthase G n=1 Tax=Salinibacillus aidingensis TaxID=237684 RepID=A0ABP3KX66_9BACI
MGNYVTTGNYKVAEELYEFINQEVLPGTGLDQDTFWTDVERVIGELMPENQRLLEHREKLQKEISQWHKENKGNFNFAQYKAFLEEIGYLEPEVSDFKVTTQNVDDEVTIQAGPQLVVPVNNARYALNAANARWGSLYDALYGSDIISEEDGAEKTGAYNPIRGQKVIAYAREFLDQAVPLANHSHKEATGYKISNGQLSVSLENGETANLMNPEQLIGYTGKTDEASSILLKNNDLHIEIQIDKNDSIGRTDLAGVKDVYIESAITTIMDCEDSVTAVDVEDKVLVYKNWLGLTKGDLTSTFSKNGKTITRSLNPDREYTSVNGETVTLHGRSLMFVRNVGHLMTTSAVLNEKGQEVPEGILDCIITSLIAKHDLLQTGSYRNSSEGSVYIVKPKMHGSKEVAFSNQMFEKVEDMLGLERNTLKIGVMDEERRTTLNLKNCIKEVKDRIVFINTGFLDRTGDEIHTSMEAGPMVRKNDMKSLTWLQSYEKANVSVGLACGLQGHAQIGKGMWAMPELMKDMIEKKIGQLEAGANTAWVPSPTAATLHALHYHQVDVKAVQAQLINKNEDYTDDILTIPIAEKPDWTQDEIQEELNNNAQGILGYVVRWVDQGIGCSTVPDINDIGLMEDRATLRISSQHMANWLHHGICTEEQVVETLKRMSKIVDEQNAGDPNYQPMYNNFDQSVAFQAAKDLVLKGYDQPNGYTEPILHKRRLEVKSKVTAN